MATAPRTFWIVPFERNPRFTGRDAELERLEELLSGKDRTAKVAVAGLGGVGKTQLALELLFRTRDKDPDCSVIWIPLTSKEALHQAYLDAVQQLGIAKKDDDKADVKKLVQEYLSKGSTGRWLLVFDNADGMDLWTTQDNNGEQPKAQPLIEYLPKSSQGAILFTTRNVKLAVKLAQNNIVKLPEMEEEAAERLLKESLSTHNLSTIRGIHMT